MASNGRHNGTLTLRLKPRRSLVGNVCRRTNPEAVAAAKRGIAYVSFPQALSDLFLASRRPAVIAGTHGKTTTTALVTFLLDAVGLEPGFLLGGVAKNFGAGYRLCKDAGGPFVGEGDEYDTAFFDKGPKFLHYRPQIAVLNNIEFDHADIYDDIDEIVENFDRLVDLMGPGTCLVANADDALVQRSAARAAGKIVWFGLTGKAGLPVTIQTSTSGVRFELGERGADRDCSIAYVWSAQYQQRACRICGLYAVRCHLQRVDRRFAWLLRD